MAGILIALSVQVKLISIIFFGYFAADLLRKKKINSLLEYSIVFTVITIVSFVLMDVSVVTFIERVFYNVGSYWQSLPGLVHQFAPQITIPFTLLFAVAGLLLLALQMWKKVRPVTISLYALFLYLLFFTGAYWNWYVLWVFMFVPFTQSTLLKKTAVLFTLTSFFAYPLLWFSHRFGFGHPAWSIIQYLWIFGTVIVYAAINYKREQRN